MSYCADYQYYIWKLMKHCSFRFSKGDDKRNSLYFDGAGRKNLIYFRLSEI